MNLGNKECDYKKKNSDSDIVRKDYWDDFKCLVHIVYLGQIISLEQIKHVTGRPVFNHSFYNYVLSASNVPNGWSAKKLSQISGL